METIFILTAFFCGLGIRQIGLPPLLGYLAAGFLLSAFYDGSGEILDIAADLGITLLLFTIGLKLDIKKLLKPYIWAVTSLHMLITVGIFSSVLMGLGLLGLGSLEELTLSSRLLIAFALSFSSTVFAVKVLEEYGEMNSLHGVAAIGVLVMQDIIAVLFLVMAEGNWPAWYAPAVLVLIFARPLLIKLMQLAGHGELLILLGFAMALGGYSLFQLVGLKGDLGALFIGAVIAGHFKSNELAKGLLAFKDFFLIGFFLSIGLMGLPGAEQWVLALIFAAIAFLIKPLLYLVLFSRFHLQLRTSFFSALALSNFSEFGLIVAAIANRLGLLDTQWTVTIALSLSITFVGAALLNQNKRPLYRGWKNRLKKLETQKNIPEQQPVHLNGAEIMILGMGRVGTGAYTYLQNVYGDTIIGLEQTEDQLQRHREENRNVIRGDATSVDFWERVDLSSIKLVLLSLTNTRENLDTAGLLREYGYTGCIGATAKYPDEVAQLQEQGLTAFNLYAEAGAGFAEHVHKIVSATDNPTS